MSGCPKSLKTHIGLTDVAINLKIEFQILLLAYKALNDHAPPYFDVLIAPYYHTRSLCSSENGNW